jgi:cytochrome c556
MQPQRPPQQIVDERVAIMKSYVNTLIQSGKVVGGNGTVAEALDRVAAARAASANLSRLFPRGTAPGDAGVVGTRALPPVWADPTDFAAKAQSLETAWAGLEAALRANSVEQTKAAIDPVKKACLACHATYRAPDKS